ncbi:MAG: hypothetical protein HN392_10250 [Anaerolineae bacterium]|jgi:hypothetical protein|nr:hypothetical protein [Anaerolineae bacterium]MBT7781601.1 hypothetical protein [Anaerolineae bacterium]
MLTLLLAGLMALIYGAIIAFGALKLMRQEKLTPISAALLGFTGLIIMLSALFIPFQIPLAFYALLAALIAMHALAIKNDLAIHDKFILKNYILKFIISLLILIMAFLGTFSI